MKSWENLLVFSLKCWIIDNVQSCGSVKLAYYLKKLSSLQSPPSHLLQGVGSVPMSRSPWTDQAPLVN